MKVPGRFIIGLGIGLLLAIGFFVHALYGQLGRPTQSTQWSHDILQKKEALAARIPGSRLFLVAGSSCLFGLNAQLIQEKTGYPTINLASHVGLGLPYILYRTKKTVRPGDTVLLALEYEFYSDASPLSQSDDFILSRDPDYFRHLPWLVKLEMATRVPYWRVLGWNFGGVLSDVLPGSIGKFFQREKEAPAVTNTSSLAYAPIADGIDCLDDNGDEVYNLKATRPQSFPSRMEEAILKKGLASFRTKGFTEIASFLKWARADHVRILATFPNIVYHLFRFSTGNAGDYDDQSLLCSA